MNAMNNGKPLVSVIMGVYNCKNHQLLRKSVQSIIRQTYENWEFIICNDGSTDDTLIELKQLEQMDTRIHLLSYEKNVGLSHALNTCINASNGMYIARQDDDDISESTRFTKQVDFIQKHPEYQIVGGNAVVFDDNGTWGRFSVPEKPDKNSFLWNSPFIHPVTMMNGQALKQAGGYRLAHETRRCEDYDLFMRMYGMGMRGYNIQEELYQYKMDNSPIKKHRPMKYRIDEAIVRYKGYKQLGMLIRGIPYILKPIVIGLIPNVVFRRIEKNRYRK